MKNYSLTKTCVGITIVASFVGLIGIVIVAIFAVTVLQFSIQLFDDITGSYDIQPTGEGFFESTGGWDYRRIPLIEPYQAVSTDNETWMIDLQTDSIRHQTSISPTKLDVMDNRFIVTYASNALFGGERFNEVWFVIIPEENIEKGFTTEEGFYTYLKNKNVDQPDFADMNKLYNELSDRGYLEWYPEENKIR